MTDVTIKCRENGPLLVSGPVRVEDCHGNAYDLTGKDVFALCRCGLGKNRPFCDGSHKAAEWKSADAPAPSPTA